MKTNTYLAFCVALVAILNATDGRAGGVTADLSISKTVTSGPAIPGSPISYEIVAGNSGPADSTGITVADTFDEVLSNCTWTCTASAGSSCTAAGAGNISDSVDLLNGGTATFTATCDIDPAGSGSLTNTATVSGGSATDGNMANDSATSIVPLVTTADLAISKTDNQMTHTPGTPVSYTIVAQNDGPSAVTDAIVSDTFAAPLSNCSWTSVASGGATGNTSAAGNLNDTLDMPVGSAVTYTVDCNVDPGATGDLSNTATISSALATDPAAGNDSATDTSTLAPSADLTISKTDGQTSHTPGTPITYTILAQNAGPSSVNDAIVTDIFPAPLLNCSWTSVSAGGATGNTNAAGDLSDTLAMPAGSSVTYTATCDVDATATGTMSNTATIDSVLVADPNAGSDSATDGDTVLVIVTPVPPVSVPTMSIWSLLALLAALAMFGGVSLSRRTV